MIIKNKMGEKNIICMSMRCEAEDINAKQQLTMDS